ncbi:EndoU domain-containing protein, partial [Acidiphilium sp.]|uniref:EndoU domain-containing protein n=1 Tax=Acidiphilium sp. TaxID=527 RepID=UPI0025859A47
QFHHNSGNLLNKNKLSFRIRSGSASKADEKGKAKPATVTQSCPTATTSSPDPKDKEKKNRRAKVSPERLHHILDGDKTGGGHRAGTGIPGKTEFPSDWSDSKIKDNIESVANDPTSSETVQPNGRIRVEGIRDGIKIRVILDASGKNIITAHPIN